MNSSDKSLEQRARALHLEASRRIDPVTAGRLRAARRTALQAAHAPVHHHRARVLLPVGAIAAIALAALMVWQPAEHSGTNESAAVNASHAVEQDYELPPDAGNADPSLYQNLDFYGWLATNNHDDTQAQH